MAPIYFTVTTDLTYDQRMIRICSSLSHAGYKVVLVGRELKSSIPLTRQPFIQKRISCHFEKGKAFYFEYNLRLFFYLIFKKMRGVCAIDLDTILPVYVISKIKSVPRIYDAHELFCEMKEVVERPSVYRVWKWIERKTVPFFRHAYTVNKPIADEFRQMYGNEFEIIRSISVYHPAHIPTHTQKYILYQGAVNHGRSFETLIPAIKTVNAKLIICGDGNFMAQARQLVRHHRLEDKVIFKGMIEPHKLKDYTSNAYIGITLFEPDARSNYFSLANRFFDYIHAGVPQLCVNYPVYKELNNLYDVAVLIDDLDSVNISQNLNSLLSDENRWQQIRTNCLEAAKILNWQEEEKKLISFYNKIFG